MKTGVVKEYMMGFLWDAVHHRYPIKDVVFDPQFWEDRADLFENLFAKHFPGREFA
jgi:hypothetical protein